KSGYVCRLLLGHPSRVGSQKTVPLRDGREIRPSAACATRPHSPRNERNTTMNGDPTFLLVHGSWHVGDGWSAVGAHLQEAGVRVATPTLAGHGTDCNRNVTHDDYVRSVIDELDRLPGEIVLVGHSFGGSVISRVAERRPERCRLLVYYSAFVPRDGERVADSLPDPLLAFLEESAAATPDRSVTLPPGLFASAFANTADPDAAAALHERLVPEPSGPIFEPLPLPRFSTLGIPSAYISCS